MAKNLRKKNNTYVANTEIQSWSNITKANIKVNHIQIAIEIPKNPNMKLFR